MKERISAQQSLVAELALREKQLYQQVVEAEKPYKDAERAWCPIYRELDQAKAKLAAMQEVAAEMKGETPCEK